LRRSVHHRNDRAIPRVVRIAEQDVRVVACRAARDDVVVREVAVDDVAMRAAFARAGALLWKLALDARLEPVHVGEAHVVAGRSRDALRAGRRREVAPAAGVLPALWTLLSSAQKRGVAAAGAARCARAGHGARAPAAADGAARDRSGPWSGAL